MLVLARKLHEKVAVGDDCIITVVELRSDRVRLGFEAPREIKIDRWEVRQRIDRGDAIRRTSLPIGPLPVGRPYAA